MTEQITSAVTSNRTLGKFLPWLLVILIIAAAGYGVYYAYRQHQATQQNVSALQESQQQLQIDQKNRQQELKQEIDTLRAQQQTLLQQFAAINEQNQRQRDEWLVLDAEQLIKLANQQLLLKRDVNTAQKALQAADERLKKSPDPSIINIRKMLAQEIQALRSVPQADITGISLALSALSQDIEKIPLLVPDPKTADVEAPTAQAGKQVNSWSELPGAIWQDLKSMIVIRNYEEPIKALMTPEQSFYLTENLRLQLEQARLAMLSGEAGVYKERLTTASQWLSRYYDKKAKPTQAALETIAKLQREQIAPNYPELTRSYQAIQRYLQQRNEQQGRAP